MPFIELHLQPACIPTLFNTANIFAICTMGGRPGTMITINGKDDFLVKESYEEVKSLIIASHNGAHPSADTLSTWQPIDTAPRTGGSYLVYCPDSLNQFLVVWKDAEDIPNYKYGHWIHFGSGAVVRGKPSHWMKRPPNPNPKKA